VQKKSKVIIFGVDGGTFSVINPLLKADVLPCMQSIIDRGCCAILESTTPCHSAPAWTTCTTGVNPSRHGISGFHFLTRGCQLEATGTHSLREKRLWHWLNESGISTGLFNVPLTFPLQPVQGFLISGVPCSCAHGYPSHFQDLLDKSAISAIENNTFVPYFGEFVTSPAAMFQRRLMHANERMNILQKLSEDPPDFLMVVSTLTDEIQHCFWHALDKKHPSYNSIQNDFEHRAILEAYVETDKHIQKTIDLFADENTTIILVSDHGFGPARQLFQPNTLLSQWGYLKPLGQNDSPGEHNNFVPDMIRIDLPASRAFMNAELNGNYAQIFINRPDISPSPAVTSKREIEKLTAEIGERFLNWKDPETGQKPVIKLHYGKDLYGGPLSAQAPDIILYCPNYNCITNPCAQHVIQVNKPWHIPSKMHTGAHERHGIFAASGPGIAYSTKMGRFSIADITPLILYLYDLEIPQAMHGSVPQHVIAAEYLEKHPQKQCDSDLAFYDNAQPQQGLSKEDTRQITDTLEGLGYL